jgi:hypothetical protein
VIFNLENEGVGLGEINSDGAEFQDQIDQVRQDIIDGKIKDIPAEVP